jgi:hypothetical protein
MLKVGSSLVREPDEVIEYYQYYLILPTTLESGVYSVPNGNEYQRQNKCFWVVDRGRCVMLTALPPSVSRFYRQCFTLNISQPYRPPRPVTGIALLFYM